MNRDEKLQLVLEICERYGSGQPGALLNILSDISDALRYIPEESIPLIAAHVSVSENVVKLICSRSVRYCTDEVGDHLIVVCDGSVCHNRGAVEILQALEFALGISDGQTTDDGCFTIKTVSCVGSCANAPLLSIDGAFKGHVRNNDIPKMIEAIQGGE